MSQASYRAALDAAVREYETLLQQKADVDARLAQVAESIGTLTRLCGYIPTVAYGLTEACKTSLRCAAAPMTPLEVRDRLQSTGFDINKYSNPLAAIHTVLRRLTESGDVRRRPASRTKGVSYEFRAPEPRAIAHPAHQSKRSPP
jgi:hypothetical protein